MTRIPVDVGTEVVFIDRYRKVHEGTIKRIDHEGGKAVSASIDVPGDVAYLMPWSKLAVKGTPRADGMLAAQQRVYTGTVVQVKLPKGKTLAGLTDGDYGVVIGDKGEIVNVARLGGHGGSYARLNRGAFTVVHEFTVTAT